MPSELDLRLAKATEMLTATGAPMALTAHHAFGVDLPMVAVAPPAMSHYFAYFCAQHGDTEFIVDGDQRLSFKQTYAAADRVAKALVKLHNVQRGDRIGIAMRNAPA